MQCRICGTETNVEFRNRSMMALCVTCHRDTPRKVSRDTFDREYWGDDFGDVPLSTRQSFWKDYRMSRCSTVAEYLKETTDSD